MGTKQDQKQQGTERILTRMLQGCPMSLQIEDFMKQPQVETKTKSKHNQTLN